MSVDKLGNADSGNEIEQLVIGHGPVRKSPTRRLRCQRQPPRMVRQRCLGFNEPGVEIIMTISPIGILAESSANQEIRIDDESKALRTKRWLAKRIDQTI